jgi:hypothetical protein
MTEEKNRPCNQCGAEPGERHRDWDDIARCRSTGYQLIQCEGELHEYNGVEYGQHEGPCGPDIWDGEYPGVKQCRELGWYTTTRDYFTGEERITEDLNRLYGSFAKWDREAERFIINETVDR